LLYGKMGGGWGPPSFGTEKTDLGEVWHTEIVRFRS
jgi:hypothetical protein